MPGEILFSATCAMTTNKGVCFRIPHAKNEEKFFAAHSIVMCMNKRHFPVCYPICMGMPLEQISTTPMLSNVVYHEKEKNIFHFSLQPKVHLQHLGKTSPGRKIVLGKIILLWRKKLWNCLCFKKANSRNNTELKLISTKNVCHIINLKRIISHTVLRLLHGQDHRTSILLPLIHIKFVLRIFNLKRLYEMKIWVFESIFLL